MSNQRIALSRGQIVILDQASPNIFHGHVRTWKELKPDMQNKLYEMGWIKNPKKGSIKWPDWS